MTTPAIPLPVLVRAMQAIDRTLEDDRTHMVKLPAVTYFELLRASGELQAHIDRLGAVPVAVAEAA
jgi:hypothetical protein